jgi:hypothetical protein
VLARRAWPRAVNLPHDPLRPPRRRRRLSQVEFIVAKKRTRNQVSLKEWNKNWHDHTIEIASGRVSSARPAVRQGERGGRLGIHHRWPHCSLLLFYYDGNLRNGPHFSGPGRRPQTHERGEFKNQGAR